ncbi:MAG: hypothetical protein ACE5EQ_00515 [Phycisphaerae bacterium]
MNPARPVFKRLFSVMALLMMGWATAADVMACSVCQGNPDSELTKGAAAGVIFLAITTYVLLLGVAGVVVTWIVRARRMSLP